MIYALSPGSEGGTIAYAAFNSWSSWAFTFTKNGRYFNRNKVQAILKFGVNLVEISRDEVPKAVLEYTDLHAHELEDATQP